MHRPSCAQSSQALPWHQDTCVPEEQPLGKAPVHKGPNHWWEGGRDTLLTEAGELVPVPGWLGKSFRV